MSSISSLEESLFLIFTAPKFDVPLTSLFKIIEQHRKLINNKPNLKYSKDSGMTISLLYGGLLAIWFIVLSIRVVLGRAGENPKLGDGGIDALQRKIRGHANFSEYVPITIILIGFLEISHAPTWQLHMLGLSLLIGRLLHGYAFSFTSHFVFGRSAGILLTFFALFSAGVLSVWAAFQGM